MSAFGRLREALTGGPRYSPGVSPCASTRVQEKAARRQAREAELAAGRRARHRARVARQGDEKKRGRRR
ncbi:hypothetical protein ACH40D_02945 [Streptomyces olivaceoviridis]|uniref:Uncharacterized protein n=1 Tax=Streptomyces olivaceoviridis TaxID=1921 RepID=A0ABW7UZS4_STROI|nr:hypothetical protein [Streptomyces corchorusii]